MGQECALKGLYLSSQTAEKSRKLVNFFEKAYAYIFTELFARKRATFKEHLVLFSWKNNHVYSKVTTKIQEVFLKIWLCGEHCHLEPNYLKSKKKKDFVSILMYLSIKEGNFLKY